MSILGLRLAGPTAGAHPALLSRRFQDLGIAAITGAIALGIAFSICVAVPHPNAWLVLAIIVGAVGAFALVISPRYEVTVTILAIYLGLLDGPVKLMTASRAASTVRDFLILAVVLGMLARLCVSKQRVSMPPLAGWVLAFAAVVVIQAFNPATRGFLKILGGYRQELEWIPFFFFGYMLIRSKRRFRQMFLVFGVLALANGAVSTYQSRLTPTQLGNWGPGYAERLNGSGGVSGRIYIVEGEAHPRPPGLGSDAGASGGMGVLALPGLLALLSVGRLRRRWIALVCAAGAMLGIASAGSRESVVAAVIVLLCYVGLSLLARIRITRLLAAALVLVAVTVGVGEYLIAESGPHVFRRQETLTSVSSAENSGGNLKVRHLEALPRLITGAPFGTGLGTGAAASGFGGRQKIVIEGRGASAEAALNLLVIELGAPGVILWVGLSLNVIILLLRRLPQIADKELALYLVAAFAAYLSYTAGGFSGPSLATTGGAYLWFAAGIAAYWFAGPGWQAARRRIARNRLQRTVAEPAK